MRITVNRDSAVPIREQLAAQIVFLIGTGQLKPGDHLPSVRELARRLGVHRNTISQAYRDPMVNALVEKVRGTKLAVRSERCRDLASTATLDTLITDLVETAATNGYTTRQVRQRLQDWLREGPPDHILVVSKDDGLRVLLQLELQERFDSRVRGCSPSDLESDRGRADGALVLSSPAALRKVEAMLPPGCTAAPIRFNSADTHVERIRALRSPASIAVASISAYFLTLAENLLTPVLKQGQSLRQRRVTPGNRSLPRAADLVLCDSVAYRLMKPGDTRARVVLHRLLSPIWIEEIAGQCDTGGLRARRSKPCPPEGIEP